MLLIGGLQLPPRWCILPLQEIRAFLLIKFIIFLSQIQLNIRLLLIKYLFLRVLSTDREIICTSATLLSISHEHTN